MNISEKSIRVLLNQMPLPAACTVDEFNAMHELFLALPRVASEPTHWRVPYHSSDDSSKVLAIKLARAVSTPTLSLKDAKDLVENQEWIPVTASLEDMRKGYDEYIERYPQSGMFRFAELEFTNK